MMVSNLDAYELKMLRTLNHPGESLVVGVGAHGLDAADVDLKLDVPMTQSEAAVRVANLLPEYYL